MKKPKQLRLKEIAERIHFGKMKIQELETKAKSEKDPHKQRKLQSQSEIQKIKVHLLIKQGQYIHEFE
jgi:dynactin complex subunit